MRSRRPKWRIFRFDWRHWRRPRHRPQKQHRPGGGPMNARDRKRLEKLERTQTRDMAWLKLADGRVVTISDTDELFRACGREFQRLPLNDAEENLVNFLKQRFDWKDVGIGL